MPKLFEGLPIATSNTIAGLGDKVGEAAKKIKTTMSGWGPFKKLGGDAPSSAETAAASAAKRAEILAKNPGAAADSEAMDKKIREMSEPDPWAGHELDDAGVIAQIEAEVTAAQVNGAVQPVPLDERHMVKLEQPGGPRVVFDIMPDVVENRNVEYEAVAPPQSPTSFQKYKGTQATQWTINATLICRTTKEATKNLQYLNQLRAWTMPYFGERTRSTYPTKLGAPPPVLKFSGWKARMVGPVPVVITGLNWNFPQDVDYIPANAPEKGPDASDADADIPFPTVLKISINIVESYSTEQLNGFDLTAFEIGDFERAWAPLSKVDATELAEVAPEPEPEEAQNGGRGGRGGPTAEELAAWNADYSNEGRNYPTPRTPSIPRLPAGSRRGGTPNELRRVLQREDNSGG